MIAGLHGHGTIISFAPIPDRTPEALIGNIMSISGPDQSRDTIDTSTMDSAAKWREFISGMLDAGEITMEVNYDGASGGDANTLQARLVADIEQWTITFNDVGAEAASKYVVDGFVTALGTATPFDDKITQSVTIKLTGAATYTDKPAPA